MLTLSIVYVCLAAGLTPNVQLRLRKAPESVLPFPAGFPGSAMDEPLPRIVEMLGRPGMAFQVGDVAS